ncbi:hypothetical protein IJT93_12265 [bacterium]|nr:hypothetical protein [bacterium]
MAVDKQKLLEALNETDPGTQWFVDKKLQTVRKVSLQDPQSIESFKRDLAKDPSRFIKVDKRSGLERRSELEGFIKIIADPKLQQVLREALHSPAPHRAFRMALERKNKEQRQFADYQDKCAQKRLQDFLKLNNI